MNELVSISGYMKGPVGLVKEPREQSEVVGDRSWAASWHAGLAWTPVDELDGKVVNAN